MGIGLAMFVVPTTIIQGWFKIAQGWHKQLRLDMVFLKVDLAIDAGWP